MTAPKRPAGSQLVKSAIIKRNTTRSVRKNKSANESLDSNRTSVSSAAQRAEQTAPTKNVPTSKASRRRGEIRPGTKLATILAQLKQKGGTTIEALSKVTGWQNHSVRGVISGMIRTRKGIAVQTEVKNGVRYYRIAG